MEGADRSRRLAPPILYPPELPITERRDDLLAAIRDHQVVIVAGETGSGKSTQLPKMCLELGRGAHQLIGHTQPRRIAARSLAERIASELGVEVGGVVGYAVRFTDRVGPDTMVKLMTDGILLAEIGRDRSLKRYDTIIIDEAHERSLNIDFLLGYLYRLLPRRRDLKVIVTSATIDTERFSSHFGDAPIVTVSGRAHPVEIRYRPLDGATDADHPIDDIEPRDQPEAICDAVLELVGETRGDILVFCSGEREIRDAAEALRALELRDTEIVPLYARLSAGEQHRVFSSHRGRRIVVATNVAETSITVPGVRSVVDTGTARVSRFSRRTKVQRLPIEAISRASADQRAGRCGRLGPGIAVRLYSEDDYNRRADFTEPEILRTNLASVVLRMASLGLGAVEEFPFVDPPDIRAVRDGVALLDELGALEPVEPERALRLTAVGRQLARLPVDPRLGRMLLAAADEGCVREVTIIVAGLAIQDPRERPVDQREAADQAHGRFRDPGSDFVSYLRLWEHLAEERKAGSSSRFRRACREQFLHHLRVREWQDLHAQLRRACDEVGLARNQEPAPADAVHRALLTGLLSQIGVLDRSRNAKKQVGPAEYRGARNTRFVVAPGSSFTRRTSPWIMAAELVETDRLRARVVAPVRPEWIEALGTHLVSRSYGDPWWDADRGSSSVLESASIFGLPLHVDRPVSYGRIDASDARELFIRHALVGGEWTSHHAFVARNRAAVDEVLDLQARVRRGDLLVDDEDLVGWFAARLPDDITDVRRFDRWWKRESQRRPDLLDLSVEELIRPDTGGVDVSGFPDVWHHDDLTLAVSYDIDPGTHLDGVNIDVPLTALNRVDPAPFDWLVPGLRRELIAALVRSLPKELRRHFSPVNIAVDEVFDLLEPDRGPIADVLAAELARHAGVGVPAGSFDLTALPAHLRPTFRIIDERGAVVADGHDLRALRDLLADDVRASLARAAGGIERTGLTSWSIGDLPRVVESDQRGHVVVAYPALVDDGDTVSVRIFASSDEQADAMWAGTRRLLLLGRPAVSRVLRSVVTREVERAVAASPYRSLSAWFEDCLTASVDQIMLDAGAPAYTATGFERLSARLRSDLADTARSVALASVAVLALDRKARVALAAVKAPSLKASVGDMCEQLDRLVYEGFVAAVGAERIVDLERYLSGIMMRLGNLRERAAHDQAAMARCRLLEARLDRLAERAGVSASIDDITWLLQELRVSLFAQSLGVKGRVSESRIVDRLTELERG